VASTAPQRPPSPPASGRPARGDRAAVDPSGLTLSYAANASNRVLTRESWQAGDLYRLSVRRTTGGWEVQEERNYVVVRLKHHSDWHRVEQSILLFEWQEAEAHGER